jgi:hypothetical protein
MVISFYITFSTGLGPRASGLGPRASGLGPGADDVHDASQCFVPNYSLT